MRKTLLLFLLLIFVFAAILTCPSSILASDGESKVPIFSLTTFHDNDLVSRFGLARYSSQFYLRTPIIIKTEKDWKPVFAESAAITGFVWLYDKYYLRAGWVNVSFGSVIHNIKQGFRWDNNSFSCNQFEHTYHGGLYVTLALMRGYSFYQSILCSALNAAAWEITMETTRPSTNDLLMTGIAGAPIGAALFRIAQLVVDDNSTGIERIVREVSTFLINPAVSSDRLFSGKLWKRGQARKMQHYYNLEFPIQVYVNSLKGEPNLGAAIKLEYRDAMRDGSSNIQPFDWFTFEFGLGGKKPEGGLRDREIFVKGILAGKRIDFPLSKNTLGGFFTGFDYIETAAAGKISTLDIGMGLVSSFNLGSGFFLNYSPTISIVPIGAASSTIAEYYGREAFEKCGDKPILGGLGNKLYYLGPGLLGKINLEVGKKDLVGAFFNVSGYWIHSIAGIKHADEFHSIMSFGARFEPAEYFQVQFKYDTHLRNGTYRNFLIYRRSNVFRLMCVFKF